MNREYEKESEAYASENDRARLVAIASEDTSMERNYNIDLPFFVQDLEVKKRGYFFNSKIVESKISRRALSA